MSRNYLLPTEVKKGDTVIQVCPWNFFRNNPRKPSHHRDEKGRSVYGPIPNDIYATIKWKIGGVGVRLARFVDDEGFKGKAMYVNRETGEFYGFLCRDYEQATLLVLELAKADPYTTAEFSIEEHRH